MAASNRGFNLMRGKVPPHNLEYEESIIASCLLHEDDCQIALDILSKEDFYNKTHELIFGAIQDLNKKNNPVDLVTVTTKLRDSGSLEKCGGASHIAGILDNPICSNVEHYAKRIKENSTLRGMIHICHDVIQSCFNTDEDPAEVVDKAQLSICAVELYSKDGGFYNMSELSAESCERYDKLSSNPGALTGIPSGFIDLDNLTCGFQNSDLIVIAARPSMGKSALAGNIAMNSAKAGYGNAIFSLEMSKSQLFDRMVSSESGVNSIKFRSGMFANDDWIRINEAAERIHKLPIWIDDTPGLNVMEIKRRSRKLKNRENLQMLIIDYLQLIPGTGNNASRNDEVSEMTRGLKNLAKELDIPLLLLSQLNRNCEMRNDKRPMLSDLRDSGAIEQDADVVLFPYRHEHYVKPKFDAVGNPTEEFKKWQGVAEINIAKQRMGPTRNIKLAWIDKITKFVNVTDM
jgi:replicative DNA helicase